MRRIWNAVRIFWRALFHAETAAWVQDLLAQGRGTPPLNLPSTPTDTAGAARGAGEQRGASAARAAESGQPAASGAASSSRGGGGRDGGASGPQRSDAISLLAALQRDARFIDLVQESLDAYTDAQIGAAARDVLRDSRAVLDRMFAIRPVLEQSEGATVELSSEIDLHRYRLTGNVSAQGPYRGRLVHHGWEASQCALPTWSGSREAVNVIAAAELEIPQ